MDVGRDHLAQGAIASLFTPDLGPSQKEPLISSKAVEHRRGSSVQRLVVRLKGNRYATQIGYVLAQGHIALDMQTRQRFNRRVLCA